MNFSAKRLNNLNEMIEMLNYKIDNIYSISINSNNLSLGKKFLEIYNCLKGFKMSFFLNPGLNGLPYFINNIPWIAIPINCIL